MSAVVGSPDPDDSSGTGTILCVLIELLVSELAVEALDPGILDGLSRSNGMQPHDSGLGSGVHVLSDGFDPGVAK